MRYFLKSLAVLGFFVPALLYADDPDAATVPASSPSKAEVETGLATLRAALSKIETWEFAGTLQIVTPDEYLQALAPDSAEKRAAMKLGRYRIHEERKGALWMLERSKLDKDGTAMSAESFYVDDETFTHKSTGTSSTASIVQIGSQKQQGRVPGYLDSVMLIYSCLLGTCDAEHGIGHLTPGYLAENSRYQAIAAALPSAQITPDDAVRLSLERPECRLNVDFTRNAAKTERWPTHLELLTPDGVRIADLRILSFSTDPKATALPRRLRMETYSLTGEGKESTHVGTWEYNFESLKVNGPVDETALTFDPVTVDYIWDDLNNVFINVPK